MTVVVVTYCPSCKRALPAEGLAECPSCACRLASDAVLEAREQARLVRRVERLERTVFRLIEAVDRLAASISHGERWPLDWAEPLDRGAVPFEWDDWPELDELKAEIARVMETP